MLSLIYYALIYSTPCRGIPLELLSQPGSRHPKKSDEVTGLTWGELNFLHTTDTHGWLAGHLLEREFSGDWGDFVSFGEKMQELADYKGVDIIKVDTGDRHDGNGLSDASKQDGRYSLPIFCAVDYDVVTIGNHELYRGAASLQEYHDIRKRYGDRYIVSNVELAVGRTWVPMGNKFRIFHTKNQNFTVLALGFLFNFEGNDREITKVTKVEDEIEKPWFGQLMAQLHSIDHIVLAGHIPPHGSSEFQTILNKIRQHNQTIPVSMFGGHSHIRDYRVFDKYSVALQSGRYVETIGWASSNFTNGVSFSRKYIDFNARNMALHAEVPEHALKTKNGVEVSRKIAEARKHLNLDEFRAEVPETYYTDRAPFPSKNSIYSLLQDEVLPMLTSPQEVRNTTRYIMLNTGSIRFDLFKGHYTKDTGYILSPFHNQWVYIPNVPQSIADKILPIINGERQVFSGHRSAGYKTIDDLGDDGDDVVHEPYKFYPIPNAFQSIVPGEPASTITLVFQDFMAWFVQRALNELDREDLYHPQFHGGEEVIDLIPQYFNNAKDLL